MCLWVSIASALGTACGGRSVPGGTGKIPVVGHVFVLVEENHSFEQVIGNSAMPYTNSLAQKYALATQYFANRHNSLPNYFMLTVGDLVTTNDLFGGTVTSDNVAKAVTAAGKTWKIYAESLPRPGFTGAAGAPHATAKRRHSSIAIGWISSTDISVLSPGMTMSVPSGRVTTPVTSVVRK